MINKHHITRQQLIGEVTPCVAIVNIDTTKSDSTITTFHLEMGFEIITNEDACRYTSTFPEFDVLPYYHLVISDNVGKRMILPIVENRGDREYTLCSWVYEFAELLNAYMNNETSYGDRSIDIMIDGVPHHLSLTELGRRGNPRCTGLKLSWVETDDTKRSISVQLTARRTGALKPVINLLCSTGRSMSEFNHFVEYYHSRYQCVTERLFDDSWTNSHLFRLLTDEDRNEELKCCIGFDIGNDDGINNDSIRQLILNMETKYIGEFVEAGYIPASTLSIREVVEQCRRRGMPEAEWELISKLSEQYDKPNLFIKYYCLQWVI